MRVKEWLNPRLALPEDALQTERRKAGASETGEENYRSIQPRVFFCAICYRGFDTSSELEEHSKSHRELEVDGSSCKMLAQPAGVD